MIWLRVAIRLGVRRRARQGLVPSLARMMRLGPSVYAGLLSGPAADQNGCVVIPSATDGFGEWEQLGASATGFFEQGLVPLSIVSFCGVEIESMCWMTAAFEG